MARDITFLVGLSKSSLLTLRSSIETGVVSGSMSVGQSLSAVSTRDLNVSYTLVEGRSPEVILQACNYALQKIDPDTYGTSLIRRKVKWVS